MLTWRKHWLPLPRSAYPPGPIKLSTREMFPAAAVHAAVLLNPAQNPPLEMKKPMSVPWADTNESQGCAKNADAMGSELQLCPPGAEAAHAMKDPPHAYVGPTGGGRGEGGAVGALEPQRRVALPPAQQSRPTMLSVWATVPPSLALLPGHGSPQLDAFNP